MMLRNVRKIVNLKLIFLSAECLGALARLRQICRHCIERKVLLQAREGELPIAIDEIENRWWRLILLGSMSESV